MSDAFWKPLRRVTPADAGIECKTRMRTVISPIIIEQDGPRTTLRRRHTDESRTLHDHATDDEIGAAVDAWCAEIDRSVRVSPDEQAGTVTLETPLATRVLVHADGGACHGTPLDDGRCPGCGIIPDMQSTELRPSRPDAPPFPGGRY